MDTGASGIGSEAGAGGEPRHALPEAGHVDVTWSLSARLYLIRRRKALTTRDLSLVSGVSIGTINVIETHTRLRVKRETIEKLAAALGTSVETLTDDRPETCSHPVIEWGGEEIDRHEDVVCVICDTTVAYAPGYE